MECIKGACPCGDKCTNQAFQNFEDPDTLEVHWTKGRGFGLRTTIDLQPNMLLSEYRGEIISQETCLYRMSYMYPDAENHYFLNYSKDEVIDGCRKGTEARFVNHSCNPNCRIEKWSVYYFFSHY
jgi:SET domain-containing protein